MSVALLFPGQGSQRPGMFARLLASPLSEATLDEATEALGYDSRLRDDETAMRSTVTAQLALLVAGVASLRMLAIENVTPNAVAGHSVGAFAAAVGADAIDFAGALRVVHERATAMERLFPHGYGMGVIVGLTERSVRAIVDAATSHEGALFISNVNAPTQLVLSGEDGALERALAGAAAAGAHRAERLNVAVPSHCPLLAPVETHVRSVLSDVEVRAPRVPYVASVGARVIRDAASVRNDLAAGVAHEVRWHDATTTLVELGTSLFVEALPGRVLTDLAESAFPKIRCVALEDAGAHSAAVLAARMHDAV
jgi:malonate decarboxylase epsilon subunit